MVEERFTLDEKQLFDRLVTLESDKLVLAEDIKQLKADAKYDEDINPDGLDKEDIKLVHQAARLKAKENFDAQREQAEAVFAKYAELTGE